MLGQWIRRIVLGGMLGGLCLSVHANTTTPGSEPVASPGSGVVTGTVDLSTTEKSVSIALLLPLRSEALREASEVLRAGFQAAYEREGDGVAINIVETGDAPQDVLSGYKAASAMNEIVVGPLSRTGATAVANSGAVVKPTVALTPPDVPEGSKQSLPPQMLVMALSVEEEARQVAGWARKGGTGGKATVLFTNAPWQRRAAKAFETQWQQQGREVLPVELAAVDGFLNGRALLQLKKDIEADKPAVLFLALDARQARQVRAVLGKGVPLYGTSQLNPFALSDGGSGDKASEMDGTRLLDIPWQLQPDHPAVMVYPRLVVSADQKRSADMERLYALGIDAYRVARELALGRRDFELDGVTGKLNVKFDQGGSILTRTAQPAVYRDGTVIPLEAR